MALTSQSRRQLAGGLEKMQPQLRRLHVVRTPERRRLLRDVFVYASMIVAQLPTLRVAEKPKKRHVLRTAILAGSIVAAGTTAAAVVCGRRGWCGVAGKGGRAQWSRPEPKAPDTEPEHDEPVTEADSVQDTQTPRAA